MQGVNLYVRSEMLLSIDTVLCTSGQLLLQLTIS